MKISQLKVIPFSIPFVNPLQTSNATYAHRDGVWLKMKWENLSGFGEAAPLPGFSKESLKEVNYSLESFHHSKFLTLLLVPWTSGIEWPRIPG